MNTLNDNVKEYTSQLNKGHIQKAYKGIMNFMSELKVYLESQHPDYITSALYFGYMDMSYFAFTPSILKDKKLKIAIVYLHEECKFELWLAANNRKIQEEYVGILSNKNLGRFTLSQIQPGVDSIIASTIIEQPNFDNLAELKKQLEIRIIEFVKDINSIILDTNV